MKRRISMTLDEEVVRGLDAKVDGINVMSRSHAAERIIAESVGANRVAVILCGGESESLRLKGEKTFRPLAHIDGKTLIEYQLDKCREIGTKKVLLAGNKELLDKIFEAVGDGKRMDLEVKYFPENEALGNAKTLELVKEEAGNNFLVLPSDYYFTFDLDKLYRHHAQNGGIATMVVYAGKFQPSEKAYYVAMDGNTVTECKMGTNQDSSIIATLVFVANKKIFSFIPPGSTKCTLGGDVFPALARAGGLNGYLSLGIRINVHSAEDLQQVKNLGKKR